jgi:hypothetical protein
LLLLLQQGGQGCSASREIHSPLAAILTLRIRTTTNPRRTRDSLVRNTLMQYSRFGRSQMFDRKSVVQGGGDGTGPSRPVSRTSGWALLLEAAAVLSVMPETGLVTLGVPSRPSRLLLDLPLSTTPVCLMTRYESPTRNHPVDACCFE